MTKGVASLGDRIKCAAEDLYAERQLGDKQYIRQQLDCVLSRGPCDENGTLIRSECLSHSRVWAETERGKDTTYVIDIFLLQEWRRTFSVASVRGLVTSARGTRSGKRWP